MGSAGRLVKPVEILEMMKSVKHRGPDDEGYVLGSGGMVEVFGGEDTPKDVYLSSIQYRPSRPIDPSINEVEFALGNRRLAILDLSPAGHQPQCNNKGTLWLTYNGEIYNYREVREELKSEGYTFVSDSDTEVILCAYERWGKNCVTKFNGMWAFAILDLSNRVLFCSRDRFGVKPFFYFSNERLFAFASEIKQLLQVEGFNRKVNDPILYDFLAMGRMAHTDQTCFEGVMRLPAGHNLIVSLDTLKLTLSRFYSLPYTKELGCFEEQQARTFAKGIETSLRESVKRRLVSDVPVCLSLSGGLDSSAIVCESVSIHRSGFVSRLDIRPYTIRFDDPYRDEGPKAHAVTRYLGVPGKEVYVNGDDIWENLEALAWYFDEPIFSSHMYAKWKLLQTMHEDGFKVTLDGQGGDEAFCGYESYYSPFLINLLVKGRIVTFLQESKATAERLSVPLVKVIVRAIGELLYVSLPTKLRGPLESKFFPTLRFLNHGFDKQYRNRISKWLDPRSTYSIQERLFLSETKYILPSHLHNEDRASMSFSVEMRLPFLDYTLVESAFAIPGVFKVHNGWLKYVLRESMRGILPENSRLDPVKQGLEPDERKWMLAQPKLFREYLRNSSLLPKYVKIEAVESELGKLIQNDSDLIGHAAWRILMVAVWLKVFFSERATVDPERPKHLNSRQDSVTV